MRIVFVFAVVVYTIGWWLIGLAWLLGLILPYFIIGGTVVYVINRDLKRRADVRASLERDAHLERELNDKELAAWRSAVEDQRRQSDRRNKALLKFDSTRPPRT